MGYLYDTIQAEVHLHQGTRQHAFVLYGKTIISYSVFLFHCAEELLY